jgi:hypothetical protein
MNIDQGIKSLANSGYNIFLSEKVKNIPENIYIFNENQKAKTLVLIGHGGKKLWEKIPEKLALNPIDDFTFSQLDWFAENILKNKIEILFPNENLVLPLQKLGRFFNLSRQSPIGIDISNEYGLWFSVRGVFLTNNSLPIIKLPHTKFPCELCHDRPCLKSIEFNQARLNCPIKNEHQYTEEQLQYHQSVLVKLTKTY